MRVSPRQGCFADIAQQRSGAQHGSFDQTPVNPVDEAYVFTPPGFDHEGKAAVATGPRTARFNVTVIDRATGEPTSCRVNVVGTDGNFYQPADNSLLPFSLTGRWPDTLAGNRPGKAADSLLWPLLLHARRVQRRSARGAVASRGLEGLRIPARDALDVRCCRHARDVRMTIAHSVPMAAEGWYSGDLHLHFIRASDSHDDTIFDLLDAEDLHQGTILCYNETNLYSGAMPEQVTPQLRGLGAKSVRRRGDRQIISGQEYRNGVFGHINLFLRDTMVLAGEKLDPNLGPVFGTIGAGDPGARRFRVPCPRRIRSRNLGRSGPTRDQRRRALAIWHLPRHRSGGLVPRAQRRLPLSGRCCERLSGLPQAGRLPHLCASGRRAEFSGLASRGRRRPQFHDHRPATARRRRWAPARRHHHDRRRGAADRESPCATVRSETAPVTTVHLVVNGRVVRELNVPAAQGTGQWLELEESIELTESSWLAARAFSKAPSGSADAESHTNPVYVYLNGQPPCHVADIDWLVARLDEQISDHEGRKVPEKAVPIAYFRRSREMLMELRQRAADREGSETRNASAEKVGEKDATPGSSQGQSLAEVLKPVPAALTGRGTQDVRGPGRL